MPTLGPSVHSADYSLQARWQLSPGLGDRAVRAPLLQSPTAAPASRGPQVWLPRHARSAVAPLCSHSFSCSPQAQANTLTLGSRPA